MKALIIGAAPCGPDGVAKIASLAEDAELVIAADGGGEHCLRAGVTPDLLVGDIDSLSEGSELALKARGSVVMRFPVEKDETDLDLALGVARERGATDVTLTCVLGGRIDQTLATLGSVASSPELRPVVEEVGSTTWIVDSLHRRDLALDETIGRFSVVAVLGDATVSVSGARWPLDRAELSALSSWGISNARTEPDATVTVHTGIVAVIADLNR